MSKELKNNKVNYLIIYILASYGLNGFYMKYYLIPNGIIKNENDIIGLAWLLSPMTFPLLLFKHLLEILGWWIMV